MLTFAVKMKRLSVFGISLLAGLAVAVVVFVAVVTTVGRGYCTEKWVPRLFAFKTECLRRSHSPRFVIMSGSNSQNCIDCDELANRLQMDVVCAGLIYTVPVRYYVPIVEKYLQPGDILYLPLETWHYWMKREELLSPFAVSFTWGVCPKIQQVLPIGELTGLYLKKGLPWIQRVLPKRLRHEFSMPDPVFEYESVRQFAGEKRAGYFKLRGDSCNNDETTMDRQLYVQRLHPDLPFSDEFRAALKDIQMMAKRRGVRVLLGNTVWHSYPWERQLRAFEETLASFGPAVCGKPSALCLPYCCFTDYDLHCNAVGRRLFTREIADDLCRILGKPVPNRAGWPLVVFPSNATTQLNVVQAEGCVGKPAFGEILLDRGVAPKTNVVSQVLVNGKPVRFCETVYAAKNVLWLWWESSERTLSLEIETKAGVACHAERILMEQDPSLQLAGISGINDLSKEFRVKDGEANRFVCTASNDEVAYLRVRIPECRTNRYILHLVLSGGGVLREAKVGGVAIHRGLQPREVRPDGLAVDIALNESELFVDREGRTLAGIYFPAGTLRNGEEIVLVHLAFERL